MNIRITVKAEQNEAILEEAMTRIEQAASDKPEWDKYGITRGYVTECEVPESDILPVFNELIAKYPELDVSATYSEDIREDDMSAQWWRTTEIKTMHCPDGTSKLDISSSTYWF